MPTDEERREAAATQALLQAAAAGAAGPRERRTARPPEGAYLAGAPAAKRARSMAQGGGNGYTGVRMLRAGEDQAPSWEARISIKGDTLSLGAYASARAAASAFDRATVWRTTLTPASRPPRLNLGEGDIPKADLRALRSGKWSRAELLAHLDEALGREERNHVAPNAGRRIGRWHPDAKHAPRGLPEAPTFRPTHEEFADPVSYIMRVRQQAAPYGMARIVPPKGWAPPLALQEAIDNDAWWFPTKVQDASLLQERLPSRAAAELADREAKKEAKKEAVREAKGRAREAKGPAKKVSRRAQVIATGQPGCAKCRMAAAGCNTCRPWLAEREAMLARGEDPAAAIGGGGGGGQQDGAAAAASGGGGGDGGEAASQGATADEFKFGWGVGPQYTYNKYLEYAQNFKREYFGGQEPTLEQIEDEFWRIVEAPTEPVEVHYGNDLLTADYGSAFPLHEDHIGWCGHSKTLASAKPPWPNAKPYSEMPWNVMNIARWPTSVLRNIKEDVSGVVVPWLYMGSLFSAFCWHVEDQGLYSINYHHRGEPKVWYGIPEHEAQRFEQEVYRAVPSFFEDEPSLMHQIVTFVSPNILRARGIPICRAVQEEGNFIITMPGAYHGGFNAGFNMAEAVNFGPPDWLPYGAGCLRGYYVNHRKPCVISHDEVVLGLAHQHAERHAKAVTGKGARGARRSSGRGHPKESAWVAEAMAARLREEAEARAAAAAAGVAAEERNGGHFPVLGDGATLGCGGGEDLLHEKDCEECAADLYYSAIVFEEAAEAAGAQDVRRYFCCANAAEAMCAYAALPPARRLQPPRLLYRNTLPELMAISVGAMDAARADAARDASCGLLGGEAAVAGGGGGKKLVDYPSGWQCAPGPLLGFAFDAPPEGGFAGAGDPPLPPGSPCASLLDDGDEMRNSAADPAAAAAAVTQRGA